MARRGEFTLEQFRVQVDELSGLEGTLRQLPGTKEMVGSDDPVLVLDRIRRMLDAMTSEERGHPEIIDVDRQLRIAMLSHTRPHEVRDLLWQFDKLRRFMHKINRMKPEERIRLATGMTDIDDLLD